MDRARWRRTLALAGVFVGLFAAAYMNCEFIRLPFHNPWGIESPLARMGYNPYNSMLRLIWVLLLPAAGLAGLYVLGGSRLRGWLFGEQAPRPDVSPQPETMRLGRNKRYLLLALGLIVIYAVNLPTVQIGQRDRLDTFHEGEVLGNTLFFNEAKTPYQDFLCFRGLIYDGYDTANVFKYIDESVAAYRSLEAAKKILVYCMFVVFIFVFFRSNVLKAFYALFAYMLLGILDRNSLLILHSKEFFVVLYLIFQVVFVRELRREPPARGRTLALNAWLCFLGIFSFSYAIEKGIYVSVYNLLFFVILYFLFIRPHRMVWGYLGSALLGWAGGAAALLAMIGWTFGPAVDFYAGSLKYFEMVWGGPFPREDSIVIHVLLMLSGSIFYMSYLYLRLAMEKRSAAAALPEFLRRYTVEFAVLVMAVFLSRYISYNAHYLIANTISYAIIAFVLFVLFNHVLGGSRMFQWRSRAYRLTVTLAVPLLLGAGFAWHIAERDFVEKNFPFHLQDEDFLRQDYRDALEYLRENLGPEDDLFALSTEGMWYYYLNKTSPTVICSSFYAQPGFIQRRVLEDLRRTEPKFVVHRNDCWVNEFSGVSIIDRLPLISDYVEREYQPHRRFGEQRIWIRKDDPSAGKPASP